MPSPSEPGPGGPDPAEDDRDGGQQRDAAVRRVVRSVAARLRAAGCVFAEDEAALLVDHVHGADLSPVPDGDRAPDGDPRRDLERLVAARESGTPLELLLGWAAFDGLRIAVTPGVFVPRRRTELVVDIAVGLLRPGAVLVDLGCGSGAIAAAVRHRLPGVEVWAVDLDPQAVECARRNLPVDRVRQGDLFAPLPAGLRGRVDVVAANAPYVPTAEIALMPREARLHEHLRALDGGPDGLDVQRRAAAQAPGWLRPGGHLLVETSTGQAPATLALMRNSAMASRLVLDDDPGGQADRGGCVALGRLAPPRG